MNDLASEIIEVAKNSTSQDNQVNQLYLERVKGDLLTRDENERSHFCVYFLPFNPATKQVFIVHHKKAGIWLSPGGHIDKGEDLLHALNREIKEELGMENTFEELPQPFLLTITPIENTTQPCKEHFDIWFLVETDGTNFNVDPHEFHTTKWAGLEEAKTILTDKGNLQAINIISQK